MKRILFTVLLIVVFLAVDNFSHQVLSPVISTDAAIGQVNGGTEGFATIQTYQILRTLISYISWGILIILLYLIWRGTFSNFLKKGKEMKKSSLLLVCLLFLVGLSGCWRPYPTPKYVEVGNNETAFVIPLEGDSKNQVKFASVEFLQNSQVATKRIQIPLRWNKTGRMHSSGEWIPMVKVIKVDRTPITREWTADEKTGSTAKDQAIWVESSDSVGFSVGFLITAFIKPEDAATFLFYYPSGSLAGILDSEVRARVQGSASSKCSDYKMDVLRDKKNEISNAVQTDVVEFYSNRGITITRVAMFGGFKYENPEIQEAIDKTFVAQQEKVIAAAKYEAQADINKKIELAAQAEANRIKTVNEALLEASSNPLYLQIKLAEIESSRIEKWDGKYPNWYMGSSMAGLSPNLLLNVPSQPVEK
jgi:hypothetical protein